MKLQIALDLQDLNKIMNISKEVHDIVDILEVGTPAIMKYGMEPVKLIKKKYPETVVLADSKIVDGGEIECKDICEAGADIITVLALSDEFTITEVVKVAHTYGKKVMADLICVEDIESKAKRLIELDVDYIGIHTGVDMQRKGRTPLKDLHRICKVVDSEKVCVAGGINLESINDYLTYRPKILIVGSALYKEEDVRSKAIEYKRYLDGY